MVRLTVSLPAKWDQFLKHLGDEHRIDLNRLGIHMRKVMSY
jgi:hypothetical protein